MQPIADTMAHVQLGPAVTHGAVTMWPLLGAGVEEPRYDTFDEARAAGTARVIMEFGHERTPLIVLVNDGDRPVLLLEGERILGNAQSPVLTLTVLVPAQGRHRIPSSCVETDHGLDLQESRLPHETPVAAFPAAHGQIGAVFVIRGMLAGVELFGAPKTLTAHLPTLLEHYAGHEASNANDTGDDESPNGADASAFLDRVRGATWASDPVFEFGENVRLQSLDLSGTALMADDRVVHLAAYHVQPGATRPTRVRAMERIRLAALAVDGLDASLEELRHPHGHVRERAARSLALIGGVDAVGPLLQALTDRIQGVRVAASNALGWIGDARAVGPLLGQLAAAESCDVRAAAAKALGSIGDRRAVDALLGTIVDPDRRVRMIAVRALGSIGDPRAVEPLATALGDPDPDAGEEVADALGRLGGTRAADALAAAVADGTDQLRCSAAVALGRMRDVRAIAPLAAMLRDERRSVRERATATLTTIGAIAALLGALRDDSWDARLCAARALGELGDVRAVDPLIDTLRDPHHSVRSAAARALAALFDERAVKPLHEALDDESIFVRETAGAALRLFEH